MASSLEIDQQPGECCPECGSSFAKDKTGNGFRRHLKKLPKLDPRTGEPLTDAATGELIFCGGTKRSWGKGNRSYDSVTRPPSIPHSMLSSIARALSAFFAKLARRLSYRNFDKRMRP